jgi:hypothetical protein
LQGRKIPYAAIREGTIPAAILQSTIVQPTDRQL